MNDSQRPAGDESVENFLGDYDSNPSIVEARNMDTGGTPDYKCMETFCLEEKKVNKFDDGQRSAETIHALERVFQMMSAEETPNPEQLTVQQ